VPQASSDGGALFGTNILGSLSLTNTTVAGNQVRISYELRIPFTAAAPSFPHGLSSVPPRRAGA
jgi:hypothetical protein